MGYNATVVVLVDRLDEIERDPDFGKKLGHAIRAKLNDPAGRHYHWTEFETTGQTQVVEVHHADYQSVVTVGGNCARVLSHNAGYYRATDDDIIKNLNRDRLDRMKKARHERIKERDYHTGTTDDGRHTFRHLKSECHEFGCDTEDGE